VVDAPTVDLLQAAGRTDIKFASDRLQAQLAGCAPLAPNGQPAW
jgi:hypothetical protein